MIEFLLNNEATIRLSVFVAVFATMAVWEILSPRRPLVEGRGARWITNWSLVVIDAFAVRLLVPVLAVAWAHSASERDLGLLNFLELPFWIEFVVAIVLLDMLIYWQHVASHKIPLLWRVHRVHHADRDIDVTTGARFHPVEIVLSMFFKLVCIALIGPSAVAVMIFEVMLNASAMFNHSNVKLGSNLDRFIRRVIVTPDMHRVHHSVVQRETDSNFGFFLSAWDRLFGSYIDQPNQGHHDMSIGLKSHQNKSPNKLAWALLFPFKN